MRLKSVETTPNPNSMKVNLEETFKATLTYTSENKQDCPPFVDKLLSVPGVKSVFVCNNFLTLNRDPTVDWRPILEKATAILGGAAADSEGQGSGKTVQLEGQIQIFVQTFRGIPIQVKAVDQSGESRVSLGKVFDEAAQLAQAESGADFLKERYWADNGIRYGAREEVAQEVADEIRGTFDHGMQSKGKAETPTLATLTQWLEDEDWLRRLAAVQLLSSIEESVPLLARALKDSNAQVRRLAAAALGTTGSGEAVASLADALINDPSIGVRRTAGDALSDLGDVSAQPAICRALGDPNKLVRWRAARFLSDVGTEDALPFLEASTDDSEFEVRLEIESAIQRIRGGGQGQGPVWKRIIGQE